MKVILPEEYWPNKTWNNEHSEDSFCVVSYVMGISMVASALRYRLDFGSAAVTEMGASRAQYLRSRRLEAPKPAFTLLTRDTEQQLSNGRGSRSLAEVMEVHIILRVCN